MCPSRRSSSRPDGCHVPGSAIRRAKLDAAFPFWNADAMLDLTALGSVSAAARALKAPKSSVSRSLARLEEAVGAVLVEHTRRGTCASRTPARCCGRTRAAS